MGYPLSGVSEALVYLIRESAGLVSDGLGGASAA